MSLANIARGLIIGIVLLALTGWVAANVVIVL
jgi:hypothetical protein